MDPVDSKKLCLTPVVVISMDILTIVIRRMVPTAWVSIYERGLVTGVPKTMQALWIMHQGESIYFSLPYM